MMKDDTSAIPRTGCNILNNDSSIYNYTNNVRRDYVKIGGKWYHNRTQVYTYTPDYSTYTCVDVSDFNSNAAFEPIYLYVSFCLAIFVWAVCFGLWRIIFRARV